MITPQKVKLNTSCISKTNNNNFKEVAAPYLTSKYVASHFSPLTYQ